MREIRTGCNDSCPYYMSNTGCFKPEGLYCPPMSITINSYETSYKELDKTVEDLGVLEIIKTRIKDVFIKSGCVFDNIDDDDYFHLKFGLTGKEYKKIKKWLEEEHHD